ncbi:MAG: DNA gyrase subunit A [Synechococcales cyanobacterium]
MQRSYLEYAMSVIVGRALPDVRDGLKPVHRRILYAMHELGLTPDRPFRKCARVVGDVLGKYHPHGDQAVYEALVRLVQSFSSRYPLLSGHGNFGSIDDDPPAAMRYTECRLSSLGNESLLADINEDCIPFTATFDGSLQEPLVLPARLPTLLLNGSAGIAVGMATNIPPHNLGEVVEALLRVIDQPDCTTADLLQVLPAPDFPTGGVIVGRSTLLDTYEKGRGSLIVRGVCHEEEIPASKGRRARTALVITEFPYQVNKAAWIEKVADLINQGKIADVLDLRDESDRTGIRVVLECRREANLELIRQQLYKMTPLQTTFGVILLTLVNGEPRQLGLKEVLTAFLDFRIETLTQVFQTQLAAVQRQAAEVGGMLLALQHLDQVIDIIRHAPDGTTARERLMATLSCSRDQADTILAMPLRRLTTLEQERLHSQAQELAARIEELQGLLQDRRKLLNYLKKELRHLKKHHGDPRRTRLHEDIEPVDVMAEAVANTPTTLHLSHKGYIRRYAATRTSRTPNLGNDDLVTQTLHTTLDQSLLVFTASGKVYPVKVEGIPSTSGQNRGIPLLTLLPSAEPITRVYTAEHLATCPDLLMLTSQGRLKRMATQEVLDLSRGASVIKLKEEDQLALVEPLSGDPGQTSVIVATSAGRLLRLPWQEEHLPTMGRIAAGNTVLVTRRQETLVGLVAVQPQDTLLLVTAQGYAKQLRVERLPLMKRGAVGMQSMLFSQAGDTLLTLLRHKPTSTLALVTQQNTLLTPTWETVPLEDRTSYGTRISPDPLSAVYVVES